MYSFTYSFNLLLSLSATPVTKGSTPEYLSSVVNDEPFTNFTVPLKVLAVFFMYEIFVFIFLY